jgi:hypothetical protein
MGMATDLQVVAVKIADDARRGGVHTSRKNPRRPPARNRLFNGDPVLKIFSSRQRLYTDDGETWRSG